MIDLDYVRAQFPALALADRGRPRVYLDNPAGTQVPNQVLDQIRDYLVRCNANTQGLFPTALASDALLHQAHTAIADLLNASSPDEIIFGPNMTTLTFALSHALAHRAKPGDEIVVTRLDHDANISPWLRLAEDRGLTVRWLDFNPRDGTLALDELDTLLSEKTFLVAVGYASNLLGTINPLPAIIEKARATPALIFIDAVHYAPHAPIDVQALNPDFLVCSPYKFFGPHQGILWGRLDLLDQLPAYRVRPASSRPPGKFETGTQNHEAQAGVLGAMEYLADLGDRFGHTLAPRFPGFTGRKLQLHCAMQLIRGYEHELSRHLLDGLTRIPGLHVWGLTSPDRLGDRVPTVSFTMKGFSPQVIAQRLAAENIYVWDGHAYAVEVVQRLGLADQGGVVRVGPVHYNTIAELDRFLETLSRIGRG